VIISLAILRPKNFSSKSKIIALPANLISPQYFSIKPKLLIYFNWLEYMYSNAIV
jgi:hypothetical protein